MEKIKIGILKYIAGSSAKGVKFEDQPETWYNPATDEAKEMVKDEYKDKSVKIVLVGETTKFSSMILMEGKPSVVEEDFETSAPEKPKSSAPETKVETVDLEVPSFVGLSVVEEMFEPDYFKKLQKIKVETKEIGALKLKYASWSEVWSKLKEIYPKANYHVHEDPRTGMPYFGNDKIGAFVKVTVIVVGISHTVHLPVMNHLNKSAKGSELDTMIINNNIQRAFTKAIAMHGLSLYVYKGEEFNK